MNSIQKRWLYFECGQSVVRFTVFLCAATLVWATARALSYGFAFWAYLYSAWLAILFIVQITMLARVRLLPKTDARSLTKLFVPDFAISWQFAGIRRFGVVSAVWGLILSVGPMVQLVASVTKARAA